MFATKIPAIKVNTTKVIAIKVFDPKAPGLFLYQNSQKYLNFQEYQNFKEYFQLSVLAGPVGYPLSNPPVTQPKLIENLLQCQLSFEGV